MKTTKLCLILLAAIIAIAASSCSRNASGTRTDTLIVGMAGMPINLDPSLAIDQPSTILINQIYDTLALIDYDMEVHPSLAESWEWVDSENPVQLRVFIKKGVKFHNGDELTASDVKFSMERSSVSPATSAVAGMIKGVDIVNDYEVVITLEYPFVPFVSHLGHSALSIVNERAVREMGEAAHSRAPVGSSAYRLVNIVTGDRLDLVRWDQYWGVPALAENLTIRIISDSATRLIALETGEIDIMLGVPPTDISQVMNHPDLTLHHEMSLSTNYISFNVTRPPFNDVRVRHAVQHAIDLDAMVQAVYVGALTPAAGPINSRVWGSIADSLEFFDYDVERAKQLLAEAGYPEGFSTVFYTNEGNAQRADTGEVMQNMLRPAGIDMAIQILEWGAFLDMTSRGEADIFMLGWITTTGDPDYGLYPVFHSSSAGSGGNRGFYSNPEVDRLLDAGRSETDNRRRRDIYAQIQQIIRDDSPWIFQSAGVETNAVRNNVLGFRISPTQRYRFWLIGFEN